MAILDAQRGKKVLFGKIVEAVTAASSGKMPTTSAPRLVSPLTRSSGFVLLILARCAAGNPMEAGTSSSAPSIGSASLLTRDLSWSATARHCLRAAAWSASANAVPIQAETMRRWVLPA